jgi:branched-chain amino acid transport system substrate-binding protein
MTMKRRIHILAVFLSLVLALHGCDRSRIQPSGETIKVGIIGPFSGSELAKGNEGLKGIQTAQQLQPYLENGDAIELVVEDDQNQPAMTLEAVRKLTEDDEVSAIITLSSSSPMLAVSSVADSFQTPVLAALAAHPDTTKDNRFVSQLCFDTVFQGAVAALYVRDELLIDRVAIFSNPESTYSSHLSAEFAKKFESLGGEITDFASLPKTFDDAQNLLETVQSKNPELLYLPIDAQKVIRIARSAEDLGWKPLMMGSDGLLATAMVQHQDELGLLEGMLATDFAGSKIPLTSFGQRAAAIYEGTATTYAVLGIEAYALVANAINRCYDPSNKACINRMIRSTRDFTGVMGKISIESNGKALRPLVVNAIENGRMNFIVKVY